MDQAWTRATDDCTGSPVEQATGGLHASQGIERTHALFELAATRAQTLRIELYRREATRARVTAASPTRAGDIEAGVEDGIAVRLIEPSGRRGFAACSGRSIAAVDWAVASAARHATDLPKPDADWAEGVRLDDREDADSPLTVPRLAGWLQQHPSCEWVESAETVETWVASGGLVAERTRFRAWCGMGSTVFASRSLDDLGVLIERDVEIEEGPIAGRRAQLTSLVLQPEPAAQLVSALVRSFHHDAAMLGARVGEGWNLSDDPGTEDPVLGGFFDDAGFPTGRTGLADGSRVVGTIGTKGFLRRGSYRDRPSPLAGSLVMAPRPISAPLTSLWVRRLKLHPLDNRHWVLETYGGAKPVFFRVDPAQLLERCVGGVGAPRQTSRGVLTPALVFDGLQPVD